MDFIRSNIEDSDSSDSQVQYNTDDSGDESRFSLLYIGEQDDVFCSLFVNFAFVFLRVSITL